MMRITPPLTLLFKLVLLYGAIGKTRGRRYLPGTYRIEETEKKINVESGTVAQVRHGRAEAETHY